MEIDSKRLYLDTASCNLRCVMCPRGETGEPRNEAKGLMPLQRFKRIIAKFIDEEVVVEELLIGNWGEPLLNPDLPKMIRFFRKKESSLNPANKINIYVSTNLNYLKNPAELLESGIDILNISISGMTQKVYSKNHRGGHIKEVLNNIRTLVTLREKRKIKNMNLQLFFLKFIYNESELATASKFCKTYGLKLKAYEATLPSIEYYLNLFKKKESSREAKQTLSRYIDLKNEALIRKAAGHDPKCFFRNRYVVVNFDGQLYRCCLTFDKKNFLGSFFDYPIKAISATESEICKTCTRFSLHNRYLLYLA